MGATADVKAPLSRGFIPLTSAKVLKNGFPSQAHPRVTRARSI
jgi:hypothetical protein